MTAPVSIRELVERADRRTIQADPAYTWPQSDWCSRFSEHADFLTTLPASIKQADVFGIAINAYSDPTNATHAFLAAMAWGYGASSYGWWRVERVLYKNRGVPAKLQQAAIESQKSPEDGYAFLAKEGRLYGLGPAFGTKYIRFCSNNGEGLVLDRIIARWLSQHAELKLEPWTWSLSTFKKYMSFMRLWSEELDIMPAELEHLIFIRAQTP